MGGISRSATLIATFIAYDKKYFFLRRQLELVQRYHPQSLTPSIEMRSLAIQVLRKLRDSEELLESYLYN